MVISVVSASKVPLLFWLMVAVLSEFTNCAHLQLGVGPGLTYEGLKMSAASEMRSS